MGRCGLHERSVGYQRDALAYVQGKQTERRVYTLAMANSALAISSAMRAAPFPLVAARWSVKEGIEDMTAGGEVGGCKIDFVGLGQGESSVRGKFALGEAGV